MSKPAFPFDTASSGTRAAAPALALGPAAVAAYRDAVDPLSDVLEQLRLDGAVFFLWEPSWPYAMHVADGAHFAPLVARSADRVISYHVVIEGPCWGAVEGAEPVRLDSGDVLVLPRGGAYVIANERCLPAEVATDVAGTLDFFRALARGELPPVVRDGGPGPGGNRLVCGFLGCSTRPFDPLLRHLPPLIRLPAEAMADGALPALVRLATEASREHHGGERCLLQRLSELLFVEVLRRCLGGVAAESGWVAGLRDPLVGRALATLHARIDERWTLQRLAEHVGSSRSTLAERFARLVGEPPMTYLAHWRLNVAASRLDTTNAKVYAVAREVVTVNHFPPGTSKWNKIEHRLFSVITRNWRGKPLHDYQTVVELIGATKTKAGLEVRCALDENTYEKGREVSDEEMDSINLHPHRFHGEWNYTIEPRE